VATRAGVVQARSTSALAPIAAPQKLTLAWRSIMHRVSRQSLSRTDVEQEVALLVFEGASNEAIANRRGVSPKTVTNQRASVYRKLHVSSRAELVRRLQGAR
jgi:DNA-binding CsgD family transcriptional regulator